MVNLRAIVPNPDGVLLPGIFLRGDIYQGVLPNAPVVIASGVQREANGVTYVYIIDDKGAVARRNVKLSYEYDKYFVITDGIKVGDKVITSNVQKIREGVPVVPIDPNAKQQAPASKQ